MSTLKVSKIEPVSSGGDCIVNATNIGGHKNILLNGAMKVAQRQTTLTGEGYVCDRWKTMFSGHDEEPTTTQHDLTSSDTGPWEKGFRKSLHIQNGNQTSGAGSADYLLTRYVIEAQDLANSGWDYTSSSSYITLQFWVRSSVAQNFHGYLRSRDGTALNYHFETGSLSANTWTRVIKKIPGNSNLTINDDNGQGMFIVLHAFRGTDTTEANKTLDAWSTWSDSSRTANQTSTWWTTNDATLEFTGVQLEVGDIATAFEHRTIGDEESRCQRYFVMIARGSESAAGNGGSGLAPICTAHQHTSSEAYGIVRFPIRMRAAPSMWKVEANGYWQVCFNQTSDSCNTCTINRVSTYAATIQMTGSLSVTEDHSCWFATFESAAKLGFEAEL